MTNPYQSNVSFHLQVTSPKSPRGQPPTRGRPTLGPPPGDQVVESQYMSYIIYVSYVYIYSYIYIYMYVYVYVYILLHMVHSICVYTYAYGTYHM